MPDNTLRIIAFGAHPDDCELMAGGTAALWASRGHHVKFVSMTNGDIGHFEMAGGPLAKRRTAEVERCAEILGITTQVLDIHDGELMPTLENRKTVCRLIREWQADIVLCHRPNDYHADHRYVGILVQDAAVLVVAPFFTPDVPALKKNPVFLYMYDNFQKPYPFDATIVVGIDDEAKKKWTCIDAMPSQCADRGSWLANFLEGVPDDDAGRKRFISEFFQKHDAALADKYRDKLRTVYGDDRGSAVQYAEAFELCEYGAQPSLDALKAMFPLN